MMRRGTVHADGAARGNPGPAAIGVAIYDESGAEVVAFGRAIGETTNNVAEYQALIAGLQAAADAGFDDISVRLDSELLVRQMTGAYKVKSPHLRPLHEQAKALTRRFTSVRFQHVPRALNHRADELCNTALDDPTRANGPSPVEESHPRLF